MLIVAGTFRVEPARREDFIHGRMEAMAIARAEAGCIDYVFSADPLDAGRVVLYERWEDEASLGAHLEAARARRTPPDPDAVPVIESEILKLEVSSVRPLGG